MTIKDFTDTFPVPEGQSYPARLHFAGIFDNGAGARLENSYIHRSPELADFDVFAAAGGMNKARVGEFPEIRPDVHGDSSLRITSTPDSPDQNAKISGIEILKQD